MADTTKTEVARTTTAHSHNEPRASLVSNTLAILGFIIVIVIVLWGLFHIASLSAPWFSSLFNKGGSSIQVTAPATVTSGTAFPISWKYSTSEKGTYAFLYQCKDVVHFQTVGAGGATSTVPCGAAFTVATTNNALIVTPQLSGTASTSVPLSIVFIPSATTSPQVQGSATVVVQPWTAATTTPPVVVQPSTPTPITPVMPVTPATPTTPTTPTAPASTGPADLSVHITSVIPDGSGGAVATFDIGNEGLGSTGTYTFTAQLPTSDGYLYNSPLQSSLAPGDHIVNTLRFSQAISGLFSVVVDSGSTKAESRTDNNYAAQQVSMPYVPPQQYYYQQYPYSY